MTVTDETIREALDAGAGYRPTTSADWAEFERRIRRAAPSAHRQWVLPAVVGSSVAVMAIAAVAMSAELRPSNPTPAGGQHLTVVASPAPAFVCPGTGQTVTDVAARIPGVQELGKPIDVGIRGSTFCAAFAEGYISTPLASSGALRAFNASGGVTNVTVGVVDSTVTNISFTPADAGEAPTVVHTVVDLGGGLRGFYVPVHEDGTVTISTRTGAVASTPVVAIHGDPSQYPLGPDGSLAAVTSPAPAPGSVSCRPGITLTDTTSVPVTVTSGAPAPGSAVIGYAHPAQAADAQCLVVTENGTTLSGRTNTDRDRVLQYAGRVDGAHGTYQFVSATGVATTIRLTRADGSATVLSGRDLTLLPTGFFAAVVYSPAGGSPLTSATAFDKDGRVLNTLAVP